MKPSAAILLLLPACHESATLPILAALEPEDRLILGLADDSGRVLSIEILSRDGPNAPVTLSEDRSFFTFHLSPSLFMTPSATPLTDLESMRARTADRAPEVGFGSCGRCLAPFGTGPQPIYAGDACPVPLFAPAKAFAFGADATDPKRASIEAARRAIRLDFAGECACRAEEPLALAGDFAMEPLSPSFAKEPITRLGQALDGTAGLFSSRFARIVAVDGTSAERLFDFGGPILAAGALDDRGGQTSFLVAADTGDATKTEAAYFLARIDLASIAISPLALPSLAGFVPRRMERFVVDGVVRLYVAGHHDDGSGPVPAILTCESDPVAACSPVHRAETCSGNRGEHGIVDVERLSGGGLAAVTNRNSIIGVETQAGLPSSSRCFDAGSIALPGMTLRFDATQKLGALGGSLFLCGSIPTDYRMQRPLGEVVVRANVSTPLDLASLDPAIVLMRVISGRPQPDRCGDFFEERESGNDRLGFTIAGDEYKRFAEDGTVEVERDLGAVVGESTARHLVSITPSWRLLLGGTFLTDAVGVSRQGSSSTDPVVRIYGGPEPADARKTYASGLFVPSEGRFLAVSVYDELPMQWVGLDGSVEDALFPELYPAIDGDNVAAHLALDSSDGSLIVAGTVRGTQVGGNQPWLRRFSIEDGALAGEIEPPSDTDKGPAEMIELSPGTFVYFDDAGNLYAIRGSTVRPVRAEFDDPFTAEVERLPELPSDDPFVERRPYQIDSGSGSGGIAWVVGTRGVVFRVVPLPEGDPSGDYARAERFALSRARDVEAPIDVFEDFSAVLTTCPDRAALASRDHVLITVSDGIDLVLTDAPGVKPSEHRSEVRGDPLTLLGSASAPLVVQTSGALLRNGELVGFTPFPGLSDAETGEGSLLVTGRYSRLGLGVYLDR